LGEFSPTRKFIGHGGRMAKEQSKGKGPAPVAPAGQQKSKSAK